MTTEVIPQTLPDSEHGMSVERGQRLIDAAEELYAALFAIDDEAAHGFWELLQRNGIEMHAEDPDAAQKIANAFNNLSSGIYAGLIPQN